LDPFTHALASAALDRAGLKSVSPHALWILVISGVTADLDLLTFLFGAGPYFRYHDSLLHSLVGSAVIAFLLAGIFWFVGRNAKTPLRFPRVLLLTAIGVGASLLLDLCASDGVQLLWPFRARWFAWDLIGGIDPWILAALLAGIFLPGLFALISEEIGERKRHRGPSKMAIASLVIVALYIGARWEMRVQATRMLASVDFHGRSPVTVGAFPDPSSPFLWRGVVNTDNTIETVDLTTGPSASFDPDASQTHYKAQSSSAISAAQNAELAQQFLAYARFPIANVETLSDGYRVSLRDLRFPSGASSHSNLVAVIDLDNAFRVRNAEIQFSIDVPAIAQ
jgi:inner membrane protein